MVTEQVGSSYFPAVSPNEYKLMFVHKQHSHKMMKYKREYNTKNIEYKVEHKKQAPSVTELSTILANDLFTTRAEFLDSTVIEAMAKTQKITGNPIHCADFQSSDICQWL